MSDEIERIRALLATDDGAVPFDVARTLLAALDAERAESTRLRAELDGPGSWRADFERVRRHISTDQFAGAATVIADHNAAKQHARDQARRKAIEEAAAACHPTDCHCADDVRALLDGPDAP